MTSLPSCPDVVVVGAGAAGIAAGRALKQRGLVPLLLEARDRLGGRAHSVPCQGGAPLDLGCEWLHSADVNILTATAEAEGFAIDRSDPPWSRPADQPGFGPAERDDFHAAYEVFETRLEQAAEEVARGGTDRPATALLAPGGRWNGYLDAISTYYNGAPLARVSVVDYGHYRDTGVNWRVRGGYGAFIAALGAALPVAFDCPVTAIDARGPRVRVATARGTLEADHVIVTVPSSVLAAGAIVFTPALDDHLAAAAGLPLGIADKIFFRLDRPEAFAPDTRLMGHLDRVETGSYTMRSHGRPLVEGYFGGDYARRLEDEGFAGFAAAAMDEIAGVLGHAVRHRLTPMLATGWARDPLSLGSYSHALPGHADARARLAAPAADGHIVFAGESVSPHFFSTAHGAFETGIAAAQAVARAAAVPARAGGR